jgi:predicted enzyme related to lactoylglutathione lyase
VVHLWSVEDLQAEIRALEERGWAGPTRRLEVPDGPVALLSDPSGNEVGLIQQIRPGIMETR